MLLQKLNNKKREGFTLIELMIVVVIIGVLAAIAVPAFVRFVRRSKTSEAQSMLGGAYDGAQTFYQTEQFTQGVLLSGSRAATTHCVVATDDAGPAMGDLSDTKAAATIAANGGFNAINFSFSGPVYYHYSLVSPVANGAAPACGNAANDSTVYSFRAHGDLDNDSNFSTFEMAVGSNDENTLYHAPGLYVADELE